jgi:hypothetical protein
LFSLSSSFLPPPSSPIFTTASSLPVPSTSHPAPTSHSLLEIARRPPSDAVAYRVRSFVQ